MRDPILLLLDDSDFKERSSSMNVFVLHFHDHSITHLIGHSPDLTQSGM